MTVRVKYKVVRGQEFQNVHVAHSLRAIKRCVTSECASGRDFGTFCVSPVFGRFSVFLALCGASDSGRGFPRHVREMTRLLTQKLKK